MFATLEDPEPETRSRRAEGLARSLEGAGVGSQAFLLPRLEELTMPVLILCGGRDQKFVTLAEQMHEVLSHSTMVVVPEAGHAVHLERPHDVAAVVDSFLSD
jgi:2-succinyl-6-hydroxy-2,4-cyclohexadiene-1-carboxylate synthase